MHFVLERVNGHLPLPEALQLGLNGVALEEYKKMLIMRSRYSWEIC